MINCDSTSCSTSSSLSIGSWSTHPFPWCWWIVNRLLSYFITTINSCFFPSLSDCFVSVWCVLLGGSSSCICFYFSVFAFFFSSPSSSSYLSFCCFHCRGEMHRVVPDSWEIENTVLTAPRGYIIWLFEYRIRSEWIELPALAVCGSGYTNRKSFSALFSITSSGLMDVIIFNRLTTLSLKKNLESNTLRWWS